MADDKIKFVSEPTRIEAKLTKVVSAVAEKAGLAWRVYLEITMPGRERPIAELDPFTSLFDTPDNAFDAAHRWVDEHLCIVHPEDGEAKETA